MPKGTQLTLPFAGSNVLYLQISDSDDCSNRLIYMSFNMSNLAWHSMVTAITAIYSESRASDELNGI